MTFSVFKTVYLLLALIAIPQVLAGPHYAPHNYEKRHCTKCKSRLGKDGNSMSNTPSSTPSTPCGMDGTPTLYPSSTPTDTPPAPATSPTPAPASSSPPSSPSPSPTPTQDLSNGTSGDSIEVQALKAHNDARALHGADPLSWSQELADYAQNWASKCVWEHSGGPYGENLYASTGSSSDISLDAVNDWMSEAGDYDPNNPVYSHFTQVVWKGSTQLGCAVVTCPAGTIFKDASWGPAQNYVCNYNPPGNVEGEFPENVQP